MKNGNEIKKVKKGNKSCWRTIKKVKERRKEKIYKAQKDRKMGKNIEHKKK
jgi:hypothetical protein